MVSCSRQDCKICNSIPPHCFRATPGTHQHIWLDFPIAKSFWTNIFNIISTLFKDTLSPDPTVSLLNKKLSCLTSQQFKLLLQVTTVAKQVMAKAWKTRSLCILAVKTKITQSMIHSKVEANILDKVPKFQALWCPWVKHYLPTNFDKSLLIA